jgi:hypothetical protein
LISQIILDEKRNLSKLEKMKRFYSILLIIVDIIADLSSAYKILGFYQSSLKEVGEFKFQIGTKNFCNERKKSKTTLKMSPKENSIIESPEKKLQLGVSIESTGFLKNIVEYGSLRSFFAS